MAPAPGLIVSHEAAVTDNVGGQYCREPSLDAFFRNGCDYF